VCGDCGHRVHSESSAIYRLSLQLSRSSAVAEKSRDAPCTLEILLYIKKLQMLCMSSYLRSGKRSHYYAPAPVGEAGALGGHRRLSSVCPSVCLSDVAYIGSNSKTKRPRKTKLCTAIPQVICDSHTDFKVKRSKVKVGRGHIVAAT